MELKDELAVLRERDERGQRRLGWGLAGVLVALLALGAAGWFGYERIEDKTDMIILSAEHIRSHLNDGQAKRERQPESALQLGTEHEQQEQGEVATAARGAVAVVQSYYSYLNDGNTSAAIALRKQPVNHSIFRSSSNKMREIDVRIDQVELDQSLRTAQVRVDLEVTMRTGRTECWTGDIAVSRSDGDWRIETLRGFSITPCR